MNSRNWKSFVMLMVLSLVMASALVVFAGSTHAATLKCGSQGYTEVEIHCELTKAIIEARTDHKVKHIKNLGSSLAAFQATQTGDLDFHVSFTGTLFLGPLEQQLKPGLRTQEEVWDYVHREALKRWNMWVFEAFGYNNVYALAVPEEVADKYNLVNASDVAPYASDWVLGTDQTFQDYPGQGYPEYIETYGFKFKDAVAMQYGIMYRAIDKDEVDAIMAYSTDGRIPQLHLRVLNDDKNFNPPYYGMMIASNDMLEKYPEVKKAVELLEGTIDTPTMQELNKRVSVDEEPTAKVAHDYLKKIGLL